MRAELSPKVGRFHHLPLLPFWEYKLKGMIFLFRISNQERNWLVSQGCKYHKDLFTTGNHHRNITYACESNKVMNLLDKFQEKFVNVKKKRR